MRTIYNVCALVRLVRGGRTEPISVVILLLYIDTAAIDVNRDLTRDSRRTQ